MESKKVIHIHLKNQKYEGKSDFFFGSVAAAYDVLNEKILCVKLSTMTSHICHDGKFENKQCKVIRGELERKRQNKCQNSD